MVQVQDNWSLILDFGYVLFQVFFIHNITYLYFWYYRYVTLLKHIQKLKGISPCHNNKVVCVRWNKMSNVSWMTGIPVIGSFMSSWNSWHSHTVSQDWKWENSGIRPRWQHCMFISDGHEFWRPLFCYLFIYFYFFFLKSKNDSGTADNQSFGCCCLIVRRDNCFLCHFEEKGWEEKYSK